MGKGGQGNAHRFTEEDYVRLDQTVAFGALCDLPRLEGVPHLVAVIFAAALYAVLAFEATVCLDDLVAGHACAPLERVDVLRETCVQELVVMENADERMGRGWPETSREQLMCERVDCTT